MTHKHFFAGLLLIGAVSSATAQNQEPSTGAAAQAGAQGQAGASTDSEGASASVAQGTEIHAALDKPVDAGKVKPGDPVSARASKDIRSNGTVVAPRGSQLVGRVTEARPYSRGSDKGKASPSTLGIVFDRAVLKDGSQLALNGTVTAVGAARAAGGGAEGAGSAGATRGPGSASSTAGGLGGTVGGAVGGVVGASGGAAGMVNSTVATPATAVAHSTGAVGGYDAGGALRSGSRGVFGIRDLQFASSATGGAGSVVTAADRTVRLESGTQMLLVAGGKAGSTPAASGQPPAREPVDRR